MTDLENMASHTVDDYMNNAAWVARIKSSFDIIDLNKNGTVGEDDWKRWVENIKREVNPEAKLLNNLDKAMANYITALGVSPSKKLTKDEYVKTIAEMAVAENTRRSKGEKTLTEYLNDAWYDLVDKNHDGFVTLDEYKIMMRASNVSNEAAEARFNAMDANKKGKIERSVLTGFQFKFWYGLDN